MSLSSNTGFWKHWQANFWAGFAIVLPAVVSIALVIWLFDSVANITDTLLFFLPRTLTHSEAGKGPMHWYWSIAALFLAMFLLMVVGQAARHYFGKKLIQLFDFTLLRIPLLNKIYGASKQVNDAFSATNKTAFRTTVVVEFPSEGLHSLGFITNELECGAHDICPDRLITVFVPTTPNPTSGFLIMVPEQKVRRLDLPVSEAIKYIISLGSIAPNLRFSKEAVEVLESAQHPREMS